jgi:hypothetical protein
MNCKLASGSKSWARADASEESRSHHATTGEEKQASKTHKLHGREVGIEKLPSSRVTRVPRREQSDPPSVHNAVLQQAGNLGKQDRDLLVLPKSRQRKNMDTRNSYLQDRLQNTTKGLHELTLRVGGGLYCMCGSDLLPRSKRVRQSGQEVSLLDVRV